MNVLYGFFPNIRSALIKFLPSLHQVQEEFFESRIAGSMNIPKLAKKKRWYRRPGKKPAPSSVEYKESEEELIEEELVVIQKCDDETKALGAEEFVLIKGKSVRIVYCDQGTNTLWTASKGKWKCAMCYDKLTLCRGCGGMSTLYPQLFGTCGEEVMCPNCVTLRGPADPFRITWEMEERMLLVEHWGRRYHADNKDRPFVSFEPSSYTLVVPVQKSEKKSAVKDGAKPLKHPGSSDAVVSSLPKGSTRNSGVA